MPSQSRIILITVLFNCEKHLSTFFKSLGDQDDKDFMIIIVDNNSQDTSRVYAEELAKKYHLPHEFIDNDSNLGVAAGNNHGIQRALQLGEHIVLINNDTSFKTDLVRNIRRRAIAIGIQAWTCLAYLADTEERWYGGGYLSYWRARGIHYDSKRSKKILEPEVVTYAPTCLMYLHATVFSSIGVMDPRYFVYYDDTDFCYRMNLAKVSLIYDPSVCISHYCGGSTGGPLSAFSIRIGTRIYFLNLFL